MSGETWTCDYDKKPCSRVDCRGGPYCVKFEPLFEDQDEAHARFESDMGIHTDNEDVP